MSNWLRMALACTLSLLMPMIGLLALHTEDVRANGKPIKVVLTYLPGLSNWGPVEATGLAEIVMKEGEVNMGIVGLPSLSGEVYSGWLVNTRNDQSMSVGAFNTDQSEVARVRLVLPSEIPDAGWNLVLLTVEPNGQSAKSPGDRKSLAGYFPENVESKVVPSQLPKTGGDTDPGPYPGKPPSAFIKTLAPVGKSIIDNSFFTYGVVVLAAFGLGILARGRMSRK